MPIMVSWTDISFTLELTMHAVLNIFFLISEKPKYTLDLHVFCMNSILNFLGSILGVVRRARVSMLSA